MTAYKQFQTIRARFKPGRVDDLRPEAAAQIGVVHDWIASWIVEDGPYAGDMAFVPQLRWSFGWVPERDLELI